MTGNYQELLACINEKDLEHIVIAQLPVWILTVGQGSTLIPVSGHWGIVYKSKTASHVCVTPIDPFTFYRHAFIPFHHLSKNTKQNHHFCWCYWHEFHHAHDFTHWNTGTQF